MKAGYSVTTAGAVATGTSAKTILGVAAPATFGCDLRGFSVGFAGVTASAIPVLIELCYATFATNAPGTNSTARTVFQNAGRVIAAGFTAASNWTAEPTVLTVLREFLLTPNGGLVIVEFAPDKAWDSAVSQGFALRLTAAADVPVRASLDFERC